MNGDSTASTSASASSIQPHDIAEGEEDVTLAVLLQRTLATGEALLTAGDFSSAAAQASLQSTLASLSLCASLISHLALLSSNETIDEISTPTLRCFLVPYYAGMLELQRRTKDYLQRQEVLKAAQTRLQEYMRKCEEYEVVSRDKRKRLHMLNEGQPMDQAGRREAKIAQYKEEKALKEQLEQLQARTAAKSSRSISAGSVNDSTEDLEDEYLRPLLLLQIEISYLKAFNELNSTSQELELLASMPNMSELPSRNAQLAQDPREQARDSEESVWRLDALPPAMSGPRNLVDSSGRILRPFTILPSASLSASLDTRLRLQSQVFGSAHRLPTMSIDEYLDMEYERGNILQGGGAKNTEESQLEGEAKRAWEEEEDNAEGYQREEDGLAKKREWDAYRDDHKKGEGNRMNRG